MNASELRQTVGAVIEILERLGVRFHITGGLASSYYGEPRLTQDVDFVVRLDADTGARLAAALREEFIVEAEAVRDAVQRRALFQALHRITFLKVDFHVGEKIDEELERSVVRPLFENLSVALVSKEDAILSKLIWVREGSAKGRGDIVGMLLDPLPFDAESVSNRAAKLGCGDILEELLREANAMREG